MFVYVCEYMYMHIHVRTHTYLERVTVKRHVHEIARLQETDYQLLLIRGEIGFPVGIARFPHDNPLFVEDF